MKRNLLLTTALLLMLILSAACDTDAGTPVAPATAPDAPAPAAAAGETAVVADDTPIRFSMAGARVDTAPPIGEVPIVVELMEYANVEIEWIDWPSSVLSERMALAFNTGDYPDAVFGAWVMNMGHVMNFSSQGMLVPIDPYFTPEIMPNWTRLITERPSWRTGLTTPDGHVYSLASLAELSLRPIQDAHIINRTWLDRLGLDMPTTTDELKDVLIAFRDAGDELGSEVIPMSLHWNNHIRGQHSIMGWWGHAGMHGGGFNIRDGQVVWDAVQPEYKEMIQFLSELHAEGLLDQEIFTQTNATYLAKILRDYDQMVGVFVDWCIGYPRNTNIDSEYEFELIPPLRAHPDVEPRWQARVTPITANMGFMMTDAADPALRPYILSFIDLFYDTEISIRNFYGEVDHNIYHVEGIYWNFVHGASQPMSEREQLVMTNRGLWGVLEEEFAWHTVTQTQEWNLETIDMYYDYMNPTPFVSLWAYPEEAEEISILSADLDNFALVQAAHWVSGGGNIADEWDAYLAQLDAMGLGRLLEIQQNIWNRGPYTQTAWRWR